MTARSPVPVAARSKAWFRDRSLAGIVGSNLTGGMEVCCECCMLSGRGLCVCRSLIQSNPTECSVSECGHESSIMRGPVPLGAPPFICTDKNIQLNGNVWTALSANSLQYALFLVTVKTLCETLMDHPY